MAFSTGRFPNFDGWGCSSLNIDGISERVVYSESVNKMLQHGIEKSNFSDGQFDHLCKPNKL